MVLIWTFSLLTLVNQVEAVMVTASWLDFLVDDLGDVYINGTKVASLQDKRKTYYILPAQKIEIPANLLRNGDNVILVIANNYKGGPLGYCYKFTVQLDNGETIEFTSKGEDTRSWFHGNTRMGEEDMFWPSDGWRGLEYNDKKKDKNGRWNKCLPGGVVKELGGAERVRPSMYDRDANLLFSFRAHFTLSGLDTPTPTFTFTPTSTPVPIATPTPPPAATPTHTYTWTPVPPPPTAIFTPPPAHTFPPTDTFTITYTPIPTPTPWREVTENIEVHGLMLTRYFRFEGKHKFMGKVMSTIVDNFKKIEFSSVGKDGKTFSAQVTLENGKTMSFDDLQRLSWPDDARHTNLLIPLQNNKDNQNLLSLSLSGTQDESPIYIFRNFIVVPFKYIASLEVIKGEKGFTDRRSTTTMVLSLKGGGKETGSGQTGETKTKKKIEFKAPGLPPGAPH